MDQGICSFCKEKLSKYAEGIFICQNILCFEGTDYKEMLDIVKKVEKYFINTKNE